MPQEKNLYQRSGVWWLCVTVNRSKHRESLFTRDVRIARAARDKRIEEIAAERRRGETRVSWKAAVAEWAAHQVGQIRPKTAKRYGVSLDQCEPYLEGHTVDEIDGKIIAALIAGRRESGASPATVRRDLTAISQVLTYAEAREWREGNPTLSKRRLLRERRDPIVLPEPAAIEAMVAAAPPWLGALIVAARLTGCRQDELVTATRRGFNRRAKTLEVIGKGNKRRTIELSDAALTHLLTQPSSPKTPLLFWRGDGEPILQAASDFTHLRREVLKRDRTVRRFRFHDLRHLFAVEALRGGMSIYRLSQHLGHTSVKTTEIYLAFLTPAEAEAAKMGLTQNLTQRQRSENADHASTG